MRLLPRLVAFGALAFTACLTTIDHTPTDGGSSCVYGEIESCNDDLNATAVAGTCNADGSCTCNPGFALDALTGRCAATDGGGGGDSGSADGG